MSLLLAFVVSSCRIFIVVHVVAKQSEPVRIPLFSFTESDRPWTNESLQDMETDATILPSSTNFYDERLRSCKVVVGDSLPSSQTVKSKLLFVSRIKPSVHSQRLEVKLPLQQMQPKTVVIWPNQCF